MARAKKPKAKPKKAVKDKEHRGRAGLEFTEEQRQMVQTMAAVGITQMDISKALGIHHETLEKHFRNELDTAAIKANAMVANKLYTKAMAGDTASIIFWLKTRAKWKETSGIELSGAGGMPLGFEGKIQIEWTDPEDLQDLIDVTPEQENQMQQLTHETEITEET